MNNRERAMAVLQYRDYDRLPIVHFGFWNETLHKWHKEGHVSSDVAQYWGDNNEYDLEVTKQLGFDFNWQPTLLLESALNPKFRIELICELPDGKKHVRSSDGVVILWDSNITSIQSEIDHTLKDRASWEKHYKPRLKYSENRMKSVASYPKLIEELNADAPLGMQFGSLFGNIRNWMGMEAISLLYYEDEDLYGEIIDTVADLVYNTSKEALDTLQAAGLTIDYAHFWEDICFKNGPLVTPHVFEEKLGHHYKRITDMAKNYGIEIVSLDCDGVIDKLLPIWLKNGVNTMFPIEVGTWGASIAPWRELYGKDLRGVGGMNKNVFSKDKEAVDAEVRRLSELVALGGYLPCPDHRIAPDAKWELVQYYTETMRKTFG